MVFRMVGNMFPASTPTCAWVTDNVGRIIEMLSVLIARTPPVSVMPAQAGIPSQWAQMALNRRIEAAQAGLLTFYVSGSMGPRLRGGDGWHY